MQKDQGCWNQQLRGGYKNRKGMDTARFDAGKILGVVQRCADRDLFSCSVVFSSFSLESLFGYTLKHSSQLSFEQIMFSCISCALGCLTEADLKTGRMG